MESPSRIRRWVRTNPLTAFIILSIAVHLVLIVFFSRREESGREERDLIRFDLARPFIEETREEIIPEPPPPPAPAPPREEEVPPPPPLPRSAPPALAAGVILPEVIRNAEPEEKSSRMDLPDYISRLQEIIDREIEYPPLASRQRREGEVAVVFILHRSGRLRRLAVEPGGRSAFEPFNREALRAVRRAANRFPPFPDNLPGEELTFRLPIIFSLR